MDDIRPHSSGNEQGGGVVTPRQTNRKYHRRYFRCFGGSHIRNNGSSTNGGRKTNDTYVCLRLVFVWHRPKILATPDGNSTNVELRLWKDLNIVTGWRRDLERTAWWSCNGRSFLSILSLFLWSVETENKTENKGQQKNRDNKKNNFLSNIFASFRLYLHFKLV